MNAGKVIGAALISAVILAYFAISKAADSKKVRKATKIAQDAVRKYTEAAEEAYSLRKKYDRLKKSHWGQD